MLAARWEDIVTTLNTLVPGDVPEPSEVSAVLAKHWDYLPGSNLTNMSSEKLDRIENVSWHPPLLQFEIERHGGKQYGSIRDEVHQWTVDVERRQLNCCLKKIRQNASRAASLDLGPIVQRVLLAVKSGKCAAQPDEHVRWLQDEEIRIEVSKLVPRSGVPKQTLEGRRRRLRGQLTFELSKSGWQPLEGKALKFKKM